MRRKLALDGRWDRRYQERKQEDPKPVNPLERGSRLRVVAINGARFVPWRPLQPSRAGFESPALHFLTVFLF
jgi:hypothetical protein